MSGNELQQMMFGNTADEILFNLDDIRSYALKYIEQYKDTPSLRSIEVMHSVKESLDKALLAFKSVYNEKGI